MKRTVTVELGEFALDALTREADGRPGDRATRRMTLAIWFYLGDRGLDRPGWAYPSFSRGEAPGKEWDLDLTVDQRLWEEFEEEADRQGVLVGQLAEHAALYFAAELDSGRAASRIFEDPAGMGSEWRSGGLR